MASGASAVLAIRIISDASKAGPGFDQTTAKASKMSKAGAAAGKVLAVGLAAAAVGAVKLGKAAADDAEAAAKMANALKQSAGASDAQVAATERWITAQGKALGVTDDELRPAISKLARATGSVSKAQKLASLGMDIAAGSGKSLSTVTDALAKAQTGSLTGLAKLGIKTKDAQGNTRTLADLQRDLAKKYAGAAKASAKTDAGKARIAAVQWGELGEKIGTYVLPAMSKLADIGIKLADFTDRHTRLVGILVGVLGGFLAIVWGITKAQKAWLAIQAAFNIVMAANPVVLVVIAIVALVAAIVIAYKRSEKFRSIVQAVMKACSKAVGWVVDKVGELVGWVRTKLPKAWTWMKDKAVAVFRILTTPQRKTIEWGVKLYSWLKDKLPKAWTWMKDKAVAVFRILTTPQRKLIEWVTTAYNWVKVRLPYAFAWLKDKASAGLDRVKSAVNKLLTPFRAVRDAIADVVGWLGRIHFPSVPSWLKSAGGVLSRSAGLSPRSTTSSFLPRSTSMSSGAMSAGASSVFAPQVTVNGAFDPDRTAAQIDDMLTKFHRRRSRR